MLGALPGVAAWQSSRRDVARNWSVGGAAAVGALGVATLALGSKIPVVRSYPQGTRIGAAVGILAGAALSAAVGFELLRRDAPRGVDPSIELTVGKDAQLRSADEVYVGPDGNRARFDAIVEELQRSETGRKIWNRFRATNTTIEIVDDATYAKAFPDYSWSGGLFNGKNPGRILLKERLTDDLASGAALLAHEALHAIDADSGVQRTWSMHEARAYSIQEEVGRELGMMFASEFGTDTIDHSERSLDQIESVVADDPRYAVERS
jgi:hypothetical protein